jgi:hypothetical protein
VGTTMYPQESVGRNLEVRKESVSTGHVGTLSTIHANSAQKGLARLKSTVLQSGADFPSRAIKTNIADSLTRDDNPEVFIQFIADYRAEDKADPNNYACRTVMKAQAELERERGNHGPSEVPDSRLVGER